MAASGRSTEKAPEPLLRVGRYVLFDEIAAGGMASVHYGRMFGGSGFAKTVAVKRLHKQFAKDPEFRGMFLDEARLAARIRHTNVVQPVDILASEEELFVALEYVHGDSLSGLLGAAARRGELPSPAIASTVVAGLLHGLHAAHEAKDDQGVPLGIVHRDVSPHNLLVGTDGIPRVIDFGVAKASNRVQSTQDGQLKGKVAYMAPEQLTGEAVGPSADIWAAGVVLWEFLAGRRFHEGLEPIAIFGRVTRGELPILREVNPHVPRELELIVDRALDRDVRRRYTTAREMALDIESHTAFAPPSLVAAWVDRLVGDKLAIRAERLEAIERVNLDAEFEVEEIELAPMTSVPRSFPSAPGRLGSGGGGTGTGSGRAKFPSLPPPAPSSSGDSARSRRPSLAPSARTLLSQAEVLGVGADRTPLAELDTSGLLLDSDTPEQVPAARPSRARLPGMSGEFATTSPDGSGGFHVGPSYVTGVPAKPPSDLKRPDVVLSDVRWADPTAAKPTTTPSTATSLWKTLLGIALLIAATVGVVLFGMPKYVQSRAEAEIASLGFTTKAQEVSVATGILRFRNVELTPIGVDGVTIRLSSLTVHTDGSRATDATLSDAVLEGAGPAADLLPKLAIWQRKYGDSWGKTGLNELRLDGGRLEWKDVVGPGSRLEIARLSGNSVPVDGETLLTGADVSLGLLRLTTGTGRTFGPWRGRYHSANDRPTLELFFGQKAIAPELTVAPSGDATALTVAIPRTPFEELAFPADFLTVSGGTTTQVSATGAVLVSNAGIRGQGRFAFFAAKPLGLASPADGALDFVVDGKGGASGSFTFGADKDGHGLKTPVRGTAALTPAGPSLELSARSASRPCEKGGETTVDATIVLGEAAIVRLAPTTPCKGH